MSDNITKLTPFDASKRALEGTTNFRENANYSWAWIAQHTQEVNKLIDDLNIYKNGLKDILSEYVLENLEENVVNNAISKKINISDIQDVLDSTAIDKPLSANQGRILKELINHINQILTSDDTSLDELQEIVNFIKQNKSILNTLSISNIAGLQEALENASSLPIGLPLFSYEIYPNCVVAFGGELNRAEYPKLWAWLQGKAFLKTEAQWQAEATANSGICGFFSNGNGTTTFRVPNLDKSFLRPDSRGVASYQIDSFKSHSHQNYSQSGAYNAIHARSGDYAFQSTSVSGVSYTNALRTNNTGEVETAPKNIAVLPLIVAK
ncbi:hypothetical protein [Aliarcobacter butzleri]|uniref:hypothetical protein n=1 Tax=Aliarcobacter butzleri TaxID=28197 RepID=UPI003AF8D2EC